jgi:hypothetical protein
MELRSRGFDDVVYPSEDAVGLGIFARSFPPSLDDACVVAVAFEMAAWAVEGDEGTNEEFEGNCLRPSDVAPLGFPVAGESPRTPMFSHNDAKAHS